MFIARTAELETLERLYRQPTFQMAVVYGRRRVGKTALLDEFAKGKETLFFTGLQKSNVLNLRSFSQAVYSFFGLPTSAGAFTNWEDALSFVASQARQKGKFLFVFDEFPYAAEAEPALPSIMQIAIDHAFKGTDVCMVLCGSNEGFMNSEVLGRKSPLFGRRNAQIKLQPFDYLDAARLLPDLPAQDRVLYYAAFGGTPYCLVQIDPQATFEENVTRLFFDLSGVLYAEPDMLLRQELREPALYRSALDAVASGASVPKEIAERAGIDERAVGRYLATLIDLGLLEKVFPFGENPLTSRKGRYRVKDPFFAFWYRFVSPSVGAIESGAGSAAAQVNVFGDALSTYAGRQFEAICRQWLVRQNQKGALPFLASFFGTWWGTDPQMREQTDIDIVVADEQGKQLIVGECKWRNRFNETEAIDVLRHRAGLIKGYECRKHVLFSKRPASEATARKANGEPDLLLVSADDLYADLEERP